MVFDHGGGKIFLLGLGIRSLGGVVCKESVNFVIC